MFSAAGQAQTFLAAVYAGLAAGVLYDFLRMFRVMLKAGRVLTALMDLVFWVLAAALVAAAAALSGAEGLRYYLVLGAAAGVLLWAAGLRRIMLTMGQAAGRFAARFKRDKPPPQAGNKPPGGE